MTRKVLVLEDEASIRGFIVINLTRAGYEVIEAETGEQALDLLQKNSDIRVALLDIMLPGIDGFEVCRRIRATNTAIGIIMLTARSQEMDKVTGLMTGADDYVTKPFSPAELTARVDALFRRAGGVVPVPEQNPGEIVQPPFRLNTRNRSLEKNGERVKLTQVEYAIIKMFMENPGKALSREEILDTVWGRDYFGELKIVDVNIRRLRLKIEDNAQNPTYIPTVWGFGYTWSFSTSQKSRDAGERRLFHEKYHTDQGPPAALAHQFLGAHRIGGGTRRGGLFSGHCQLLLHWHALRHGGQSPGGDGRLQHLWNEQLQ